MRLLLAPSIGLARAQARAELLEAALGVELGEPVAIEIAESYAALEQRVSGGEVELVWAPPAVCAQVLPSARSIYKCLRSGRSTYRSALIMRSGESLVLGESEGLRGVWVDPLSIGGYLLARAWLREQGADPSALLAAEEFVGSYPEALREVIYEKADVTAVGIHDDTEEHIEEAIARYAGRNQAERLTSVAITGEAPTDALVVTEALDPQRAQRLGRRLVPEDGQRPPPGLCLALEVQGFERARPEEYEGIRQLLAPPRWPAT